VTDGERKLEDYLERINTVMWQTWGVKDNDFGRAEGTQIMDILEEWAAEGKA
jgi:hypothetical protein